MSASNTLSMSFEANRGQVDPAIDFVAHAKGYSVFLHAGRARVRLNAIAVANITGDQIHQNREIEIGLAGANDRPEFQPEARLPGYSNYLYGSDPHKWITEVPHYSKVRYSNVYPGIDVVYCGNREHLETDFLVQPGADAKQIAFALSVAKRPRLDRQGDLILGGAEIDMRLQKPRAYQVIAGKEVAVQAAYVLRRGQARFQLGRYDTGRTLIIDPVLVYSTFLGGAFASNGGFQAATAAAVDTTGNLYIAGATDSLSFPVTQGVLGPTPTAFFASKLDPTGTSLIYSTYVSGFSNWGSLAVDSSGNVYIAGPATAGLPIPNGSMPFQSAPKSLAVVKLNSTGTASLAGTYLGGSDPDLFGGMAVDSTGNVYLTGTAVSVDFPIQNALQKSLGTSGQNAFVSKLDPSMSVLLYSTYLGQNSSATGADIAVDPSLNVYIVGNAGPGFPTTADAFQPNASLGGTFLAKLDPTGSSVLYSTYLTGTGGAPGLQSTSGLLGSQSSSVKVDSSGNVFVTGLSYSLDFPFVKPIQPCTGDVTTFLSEFDPKGTVAFSTCLGHGYASPIPPLSNNLAIDALGNVYIYGTSDATLPLKDPVESSPTRGTGLFISEIDPGSDALVFSTFVAGPTAPCCDGSGDHIAAIAVDRSGNMYAVGFSGTPNESTTDSFPIFNALQPLFGTPPPCDNKYGCGYRDAIVMKISPGSGAAAAVAPSLLNFGTEQIGIPSSVLGVTLYDMGTNSLAVSNVATTGDFQQTNTCEPSVPAAGACTIQVTFTPTVPGNRGGALTITDSASGSPHTVALSGIGGQAFASVSPLSLSFPNQLVNVESYPQEISIANSGTANLGLSSIKLSGPFNELNACGSVVSAECTVDVSFTPTTVGSANGTITITDSATDSPQTVTLTGTGIPFLMYATTDSAIISAGSTALFDFTVQTGSDSLSVQFQCVGVPASSTCSVSPNPMFPPGANWTTASVKVTTTARTVSEFGQGQSVVALLRSQPIVSLAGALLFGIVLTPIRLAASKNGRRRLIIVKIMLLGIVGWGCGGGGRSSSPPPSGTPSGTYTITVTGTAGGISQSTKLNLTVQ